MFRAVVLADGAELTLAEFPQIAAQIEQDGQPTAPEPASPTAEAYDEGWIGAGVTIAPPPIEPDLAPMSTPTPPAACRARSSRVSDEGDVRPLEDIEADMIRFALEHYRGRMTEVARKLGIGRSTLYRKLRELELDAAE